MPISAPQINRFFASTVVDGFSPGTHAVQVTSPSIVEIWEGGASHGGHGGLTGHSG
jgi:hypothetical protein